MTKSLLEQAKDMRDIELKHVKVIIGWDKFIKHKFDKYKGSFNRKDTAIFQKGKTIYIFDALSLDEYTLGEFGVTLETYYKKPDYMVKQYRLTVKGNYNSSSSIEKLHTWGLLTDDMYNEIKATEKERGIAYAQKKIGDLKASIAYQEQVIEEWEKK